MMSVTDPVALLPYPPPQYSLMSTMSVGSRLSHARSSCTVWIGALRRQMDVQLAVLPVGHARAALEALMARVRRHERFVEHQRRFLEARSTSPYDQAGSVASPIGSRPSLDSANCSLVHFRSLISGSGGG